MDIKKSTIAMYWSRQVESKSWNIDWSTPQCFACCKPMVRSKKIDKFVIDFRLWGNAKGLQLCHVLANQFGGRDTCDNIVLLCRECHDDAPDVSKHSREVMSEWISGRRNYLDKIISDIDYYLNVFGICRNDLTNGSIDRAVKAAGVHGSQFGYGPIISLSSIIGLVSKDHERVNESELDIRDIAKKIISCCDVSRKVRQQAGIEAAKERGVYKGRKQGTTKASKARAVELDQQGLKHGEIATALGVSRPTICRYLKEAEREASVYQ